jgi:hypothetical protein
MSRQRSSPGAAGGPSPGGPASAGPPAAPSPREYVRILVIAALLGVPVAVAAAAFMSLSYGLTTLVWTTIPDGAGWTAPPWWYVLAVPAIAGLLVAAAVRLPGHGGEPAVAGIALEPLSPVQLVSALLAALASLGLGLVLGPEAPLTALGLTAGLVAARALRPGASGGQLLVVAGAFAAISTVFGGPLPSALLLFELVARSGMVPSAALAKRCCQGSWPRGRRRWCSPAWTTGRGSPKRCCSCRPCPTIRPSAWSMWPGVCWSRSWPRWWRPAPAASPGRWLGGRPGSLWWCCCALPG